MKTKLMIGSEILGKVTENDKFSCAVCSKGVGSSSILFHFFKIGCIKVAAVLWVN